MGTLSELLGSAKNVESTGRTFSEIGWAGFDSSKLHMESWDLIFKSDEHKADFMKILYELNHRELNAKDIHKAFFLSRGFSINPNSVEKKVDWIGDNIIYFNNCF